MAKIGFNFLELMVESFWNKIRERIEAGDVEKGKLTWQDVESIMTVVDIFGEADKYSIPDDIVASFEGRSKDLDGKLKVAFKIPADIVSYMEEKYGDAIRCVNSDLDYILLTYYAAMSMPKSDEETEESFPGADDDYGTK